MSYTVAKNTILLTALQVMNLMLSLVTLPFLVRVLGPEQFGVFGFCLGVVSFAVMFIEYGFNLSATRRIAQAQGNRELISHIFWSVQVTKALLALFAFSCLLIAAYTFTPFREVFLVLMASTPVLLGAVLFPQWLFQGIERIGMLTVCIFLGRALALPAFFCFVSSPADTWIAAFVQGSVLVTTGLMACAVVLQQKLVVWSRVRWNDVSETLYDSWHMFLSCASINVYTASTPVLLGLLNSHVSVGYFLAADKLRQAVQSLMVPMGAALYPRVSATVSRDRQECLLLIRKFLALQGTVTFFASVAVWLLAPWAIQMIMGEKFESAVSALRIMAGLPFIVGLSNVLGNQTMIAFGLQQQFSRVHMSAGAIHILLMICFVPQLGVDGAALSVLMTEVFVAFAMASILYNHGIFVVRISGLRAKKKVSDAAQAL